MLRGTDRHSEQGTESERDWNGVGDVLLEPRGAQTLSKTQVSFSFFFLSLSPSSLSLSFSLTHLTRFQMSECGFFFFDVLLGIIKKFSENENIVFLGLGHRSLEEWGCHLKVYTTVRGIYGFRSWMTMYQTSVVDSMSSGTTLLVFPSPHYPTVHHMPESISPNFITLQPLAAVTASQALALPALVKDSYSESFVTSEILSLSRTSDMSVM